jgi:hypothetical protein
MKKLWITWPASQATPTTTTETDDIKSILSSEYSDQGSWARHYSTVRMTLGTFFLTGSIGVIYKKWDDPFDRWTAALAGIILAVGVILFLRFTFMTFREMNHQIRIVNSYRAALINKDPPLVEEAAPLGHWDGKYLALGAVAFYFLVLFLWWQHPKPVPLPTPPVKAEFAQVPSHFAVTYSAVHQTNHGREAHTFLIDQSTGDVWQMICAPDGTVAFNPIQRRSAALPAARAIR